MKWCIPVKLAWWPSKNFIAVTIWPLVIMKKDRVTPELERNEQCHVYQWLELGLILFPFVYFGFTLYGRFFKGYNWMTAYYYNPMEAESRASEDPNYKRRFLGWRDFL